MTQSLPSPSPPSRQEIVERAAAFRWTLSATQADELTSAISGLASSYAHLKQLDDDRITDAAVHSREIGTPPAVNDESGWAWRCHIQEREVGPLAGVTVAVKDSIAVAGLPTVMGTDLLRQTDTQHIAEHDATVVQRLLAAGAIIRGKAITEDLCIGGSSCTSRPHRVDNPLLPGRSAGGSSSGSAALLAGTHEVDLTLGADQGGSIRIPAALCGVVGLKPTFGLIPFTGIQGLVWSMDHVGPMARTVRETAVALDVLAGDDGIDRRAHGAIKTSARQALERSPRGLRVGVLLEGFELTRSGETDFPGSQAAADLVYDRAWSLTRYGLDVVDVFIPMHAEARHIYGPLLVETAAISIWGARGRASADHGPHGDTPIEAINVALERYPDLASDPTKLLAIAGSLFLDTFGGRSIEAATWQVLALRQAYDSALTEVDVLVHPTTAPAGVSGFLPETATGVIAESLSYFANTCATNLTGHPSVTVPVGSVEAAPVGMHITGRHLDEATILRVALAVEEMVSR